MTPSTSSQKKKKNNKKQNPFSIDFNANHGSVGSNKLVVLKDPTGHDINERYDLGRELGRGEFGVTYLCTDVDTGDKFACKSISKKKLRTAVDIEDVRREVEIMRHMPKHPNIVTLKDTYEDDTAVHIVMELCEGGELFDRIVARGHYTERAAAFVMKTIVEVVQVKLQPVDCIKDFAKTRAYYVVSFFSIFFFLETLSCSLGSVSRYGCVYLLVILIHALSFVVS